MPYPIPDNQDFEITYVNTTHKHYMPTMSGAWHYEIALIISGDRQCVTPDHIYYMHAGCVTCSTPDLMRQTASTSNARYERILIKFSAKIADNLYQLFGKNVLDNFFKEHVHYFDNAHLSRITEIFKEMLNEYINYNEYTPIALKGLMTYLITYVIRHRTIFNDVISCALSDINPLITKSLLYLGSHYYESPSLETVAKHVGLSPTYFSKLFKKYTSTTFSKYLLLIKLQHCRIMLIQTDLTISEIALNNGFCNSNYLNAQFHKFYNETPTDFRKKNKSFHTNDVINAPLYSR